MVRPGPPAGIAETSADSDVLKRALPVPGKGATHLLRIPLQTTPVLHVLLMEPTDETESELGEAGGV